MYTDLAQALQHAAPRKGDKEYYTRMAISYLLKDSIMEETGFGIYACDPNDLGFMDHPILIDLTDNTISHDGVDHKDINSFINYNLPSSVLSTVGASATAEVGVTSR
jgi:hypothetical protein